MDDLKNNAETGKFDNMKILKLLERSRIEFFMELGIIEKNV